MRRTLLTAAILAGCTPPPAQNPSWRTNAPDGPPGVDQPANAPTPPAVPGYTATRFIPPDTTYVVTAASLRTFQDSVGGLIDGVSILPLGSALHGLPIDPFDPHTTEDLSLDLDGGVALFSETLNPTLAVHLLNPKKTSAWLTRVLTGPSQQVGDVEMRTRDMGGFHVAGGVTNDGWLLMHFEVIGSDNTEWLAHAIAGGQHLADDIHWAARSNKSVVAVANLEKLVAQLKPYAPSSLECVSLLAPVRRAGVELDLANGAAARVRLGLTSTAGVTSMLHAGPAGWSSVVANSPVAVAWNVDLPAFDTWFAPCFRQLGDPGFDDIAKMGITAARFALRSFNPKDKYAATGVVSLDVTSTKFITDQLDQIPARSFLEKKHTWGSYTGHSLSVPTVGSVDYVLTKNEAIIAKGSGLMDQVTGQGTSAPATLVSLHLSPGSLTAGAWDGLVKLAGIDSKQVSTLLALLAHFGEAHLTLSLDGNDLVLEAAGNRR